MKMALLINIVPRGSYESKLMELNSSGRNSRNDGSSYGDHFSSKTDEHGSNINNNNKTLDSSNNNNNETSETSSSNHQNATCSTNNCLSSKDGGIDDFIECTIATKYDVPREICDGGVGGGLKSSVAAKKKSAPYLTLISRNSSIESLLR